MKTFQERKLHYTIWMYLLDRERLYLYKTMMSIAKKDLTSGPDVWYSKAKEHHHA